MPIERALISFAEGTADGVMILAADAGARATPTVAWCNEALAAMTGLDRDGLMGAPPGRFLADGADPGATARLFAAMARGEAAEARVLCTRAGGGSLPVRLTARPGVAEAGGTRTWTVTLHDVSDLADLELRLDTARQDAARDRARLWNAIEALPDAFVLYDSDDRIVLFNERYREVYSESAEAIRVGARFEDILREGLARGQYLEAIGREDDWLRERMERHRAPGAPLEQRLPGDRFLKVCEVRVANGDIVGFRTDVTELKRQQRALEEKSRALDLAARTDPLTGLMNRRGLDMAFAAAKGARDDGARFAVLHMDLDRFKLINDVFGHAAGDHLLQTVAGILRGSTRRDDLVARVGGDEFVVLQRRSGSEETARAVADRVLAACEEPVPWQDRPLHFGCSIGIATGGRHEVGDLLQQADIALYEAKNAGRGQARLFTPELRTALLAQKQMADEVIEGLERKEFVAFYQPQLRVADNAIAAIEALLRWNSPTRGLVKPGQFLPVAEELGLLSEIESSALAHAAGTVAAMEAAGLARPEVCFNLSFAHFRKLSDIADLSGYLALSAPVCIELSEAIDFEEDFEELPWILAALRDLDVSLALDNFGSCRASLSGLLTLRPDRIKIDRGLVAAAMADREGARSMIRAISEICQGLGIPMTATGIESEAHAQLMRRLGCDRLQGYHISPALDRKQIIEFAAAWPRRSLSA